MLVFPWLLATARRTICARHLHDAVGFNLRS
jgi:hypothetical protein